MAMANRASFIQYMRAHGNAPGPTQRPILSGAVSGFISEIPGVAILWWSGALQSGERSLGLRLWLLLLLHACATIVCGALYGRVFSRAANDPRGGWEFVWCDGAGRSGWHRAGLSNSIGANTDYRSPGKYHCDIGNAADIEQHAIAVTGLECAIVDYHIDFLRACPQDFFGLETFGRGA